MFGKSRSFSHDNFLQVNRYQGSMYSMFSGNEEMIMLVIFQAMTDRETRMRSHQEIEEYKKMRDTAIQILTVQLPSSSPRFLFSLSIHTCLLLPS